MYDRILAALDDAPKRGQLVRHIDGGIYRFIGLSQSTEDQSLCHLYEHVWPFPPSLIPWSRPSEQWESRFVPITRSDLAEAMKVDRAKAQQDVTEAKAARRGVPLKPVEIDYDAAPLLEIVNRYTGEPIVPSKEAGGAPVTTSGPEDK